MAGHSQTHFHQLHRYHESASACAWCVAVTLLYASAKRNDNFVIILSLAKWRSAVTPSGLWLFVLFAAAVAGPYGLKWFVWWQPFSENVIFNLYFKSIHQIDNFIRPFHGRARITACDGTKEINFAIINILFVHFVGPTIYWWCFTTWRVIKYSRQTLFKVKLSNFTQKNRTLALMDNDVGHTHTHTLCSRPHGCMRSTRTNIKNTGKLP